MRLLYTSCCQLIEEVRLKLRGKEIRRLTGVFLAEDFAASCFRGAFPPVDLRAVCFVRAIASKIDFKCFEMKLRCDGGRAESSHR